MLTKTESMVSDLGMLYTLVAHTVLIYDVGNRVVMGSIFKVLEGFHHRAAWQITIMTYLHV